MVMLNTQNAQQPQVSVDSFSPGEIAKRVEGANVTRASMPLRNLVMLGLLGGLYIGFGGAIATLVLTDSSLGFGLGRLVAGVAFSLGLIMLVLAGGELFTGNNLMIVAYASRKISSWSLLRNWGLAYATNASGALLLAFAMFASGTLDGAAVKATAVKIAEAKASLDPATAFLRGILCNMRVCLAVWMSMSARSVGGKVIAIVFPISAFVALGFEHCVANFYLLPFGMLSGAQVDIVAFIGNIIPVTLGNTLGGMLVACAYYLIYLQGAKEAQPSRLASGQAPATPDNWRVSAVAGWPAIAPEAANDVAPELVEKPAARAKTIAQPVEAPAPAPARLQTVVDNPPRRTSQPRTQVLIAGR
jgi:formate/nitrite transporter